MFIGFQNRNWFTMRYSKHNDNSLSYRLFKFALNSMRVSKKERSVSMKTYVKRYKITVSFYFDKEIDVPMSTELSVFFNFQEVQQLLTKFSIRVVN